MSIPKQEVPRTEWPRALLYGIAVTCGVLTAMAAQIVLSHFGIELAGVWRDVFSSRALQLRSAGAWWLIAGSALVASALVAAVLNRLPLPWHRFRRLRWLTGGVVVLVLAEIGHAATRAGGRGTGAHVAASLAALCVATLMGLFGAYFTVRR
jgi:hypothetical protein